jgi:ATP-dependent Lon protease
MDPVFMLDEVDKINSDFRGDPSSALLEVLDPEQNANFNDHYLEADYDLSQVLFICTANVLHTIPQPLLDRMEVIRLHGYTDDEKQGIAEKFLIPKKLKEHGLTKTNVKFTRDSLQRILHEYTREAGVRNLEREIATICRKVARVVVDKGKKHSTKIEGKTINKYLGVPKHQRRPASEPLPVGVATGLAWTEVGGELLSIEVTVLSGSGKLSPTGTLGDVMKESAHAALSYVRSRAEEFGLKKDFYQKTDIHIHIPEGAVPKDGPSAGITMAIAMVSALTNTPLRHGIAMTGELTLSGKVLPIGGLKEKTLAAHRGEIFDIILPKDNKKDIPEIADNIRKGMKFHPVSDMDEAIKEAFGNKFKARKKKPAKAKPKTKTGKTRSTSRRPSATTLN